MRALRLLTFTTVLAASVSFGSAQDSRPVLTTLYNNGSYGNLVVGQDGALYGTGEGGEVFKLTPAGSPAGPWTASVLHTFTGQGGDGFAPVGGPAVGQKGIVYGMTQIGGQTNLGTVYNLIPPALPGGAWAENILYSFAGGSDGSYPVAGVAIGNAGAIFGATGTGGGGAALGCSAGCGTVFELAPPASPGGAWMETVLYSFAGGNDGYFPAASLVIGPKGALYGTTEYGGTAGGGTVFELAPPSSPGGAWTETVIHAFSGQNGDGIYPYAGLVMGQNGELYGTTTAGGASGNGAVFGLTPPTSSGAAWTETVLYSFAGVGQGAFPKAGLVIDNNGVLFGTTLNFGASKYCSGYDCGTVFALQPPASPGAAWTEIVLHSFTGGTDGQGPWASLVMGENGALYGTTVLGGSSRAGTVFKIAP